MLDHATFTCYSVYQNGGGEFDWDAETQGLILGCFFYGYALSHVPGGLLAERYGGKWLMGEYYLKQRFWGRQKSEPEVA